MLLLPYWISEAVWLAPGLRASPLVCVARGWLGYSVCVALALIRQYRPAADLCPASGAAASLP